MNLPLKLALPLLIVTCFFAPNVNAKAVDGPNNEILLYKNQNLTFEKSDRGFIVLVDDEVANDHGPNNWKSPIDYWNGQFQVRYEIKNMPSEIGQMQICVWHKGTYPETCSGNVKYYSQGDVMYNPKPYPNATENGLGDPWYRLEGKKGEPVPEWNKANTLLIRNVIRGENGCNVMPFYGNKVCGVNKQDLYSQFNVSSFSELTALRNSNSNVKSQLGTIFSKAYTENYNIYKDLVMDVAIVLVPKDQEFSGWESYGYPKKVEPTPLPSPTPQEQPTPTEPLPTPHEPTSVATPTVIQEKYDEKYDFNTDNKVDLLDVIEIIKFIFG
jgi:hypothetical protein